MEGSEDRGVHETDLRTGEGAIFVNQELSDWLLVAQLETLEVDDWGDQRIKGSVLHCDLSVCPARRKPSSHAAPRLPCISRRSNLGRSHL